MFIFGRACGTFLSNSLYLHRLFQKAYGKFISQFQFFRGGGKKRPDAFTLHPLPVLLSAYLVHQDTGGDRDIQTVELTGGGNRCKGIAGGF